MCQGRLQTYAPLAEVVSALAVVMSLWTDVRHRFASESFRAHVDAALSAE